MALIRSRKIKSQSLNSLITAEDDDNSSEEEYLVEESDDIAYVRSVRSMNYDLSHASFPDYKVKINSCLTQSLGPVIILLDSPLLILHLLLKMVKLPPVISYNYLLLSIIAIQ
jgi:hypothetical protein